MNAPSRSAAASPAMAAFGELVGQWIAQLTLAEPQTFAAGLRLSERARQVATALECTLGPELEAAARLLRVGMLAMPFSVLAKMDERVPLAAAEADLLARVPELGAQLLESAPLLTAVGAIVRYQAKGCDGSGAPRDGIMGSDLPLGARILCPLVALANLELAGHAASSAILELATDAARYDGDILSAIAELAPEWVTHPPRPIEVALVEDLRPGMELDDDIVVASGQRLATSGTSLSQELIMRLRDVADLGQLAGRFVVIRPLRVAMA